MARKRKPASPHSCETLPVLRPEIGSLPLWCVMLFSVLLAALTELFLLRAGHALAKEKLAAFEGLLRKCAGFLRTTSENSNWPSSVMSSPLMMRGRRLLEDINSALGIAGEEKRAPDAGKKKEEEEDSGGDRAVGKAKPRRARHPGAARKIHRPDRTEDVEPGECPHCHGHEFAPTEDFELRQVLDVAMQKLVTHYLLRVCICKKCGRRVRAGMPPEALAGIGPGLAAAAALLTALGVSRRKVQAFFKQTCGIDISQGAIQNCLDRTSEAVQPHCDAIARESRRVPVSHVDETSSRLFGPPGRKLHWLWVMVCPTLCFFNIMPSRSAEAFAELVGEWLGILVSDSYVLYLKWAGMARQCCLAHLIRKAVKFAEDPAPEIARGGRWILAELRRLVEMARKPPTNGEYAAWRGRFWRCVRKYEDAGGELGTYAQRLRREADCMVTFLSYEGVDPTNNRAERALRPFVCRRKTSFGSTSAHGEADISKLMTLHETCRLNGRSTYAELKAALEHRARGKTPSLYWIRKAGMKAGARPPHSHRPHRFAPATL